MPTYKQRISVKFLTSKCNLTNFHCTCNNEETFSLNNSDLHLDGFKKRNTATTNVLLANNFKCKNNTCLLLGFQSHFTGVISTIPSCARHRHVLIDCTKWLPELKVEKSCPTLTGQTTGWISTKLNMKISTIPSCVYYQHVSLCCIKWSLQLKTE
jgi:hypothetical protein